MADDFAGGPSTRNESPSSGIESMVLITESSFQGFSNDDDAKSDEIEREKTISPSLEIAQECIESFIHQGFDSVENVEQEESVDILSSFNKSGLEICEPLSFQDHNKEESFTTTTIQENVLETETVSEKKDLNQDHMNIILEAKNIVSTCLLDAITSDDRLSIDADDDAPDDNTEKGINIVDANMDTCEGSSVQKVGTKPSNIDETGGKTFSKTDMPSYDTEGNEDVQKFNQDMLESDVSNAVASEVISEGVDGIEDNRINKKEKKKHKHHKKNSKKKKKKHKKEKREEKNKDVGVKLDDEESSDGNEKIGEYQVFGKERSDPSNSKESRDAVKDSSEPKPLHRRKLVSIVAYVSSGNETNLSSKESNNELSKEDSCSPRNKNDTKGEGLNRKSIQRSKNDRPSQWSSDRSSKSNESVKDVVKDVGVQSRKFSSASKFSDDEDGADLEQVGFQIIRSLDEKHKSKKKKSRQRSREEENKKLSQSSDKWSKSDSKTEEYRKKSKRKRSESSESEEKRSSRRYSEDSLKRSYQFDDRKKSRKTRSKSRELEKKRNNRHRSRSRSIEKATKDQHRSRSRSIEKATKDRHRSRSRSIEKATKDRYRSRSRSLEKKTKDRHRSRSRSIEKATKDRHRSRSRSKEKPKKYRHRSRSRSEDQPLKDRRSRSRSKEKLTKYRKRSRSRSKDRPSKHHRSRSRSKEKLTKDRHRSRSRSKDQPSKHYRSRSTSIEKATKGRHRSRSRSNDQPSKYHRFRSRSKDKTTRDYLRSKWRKDKTYKYQRKIRSASSKHESMSADSRSRSRSRSRSPISHQGYLRRQRSSEDDKASPSPTKNDTSYSALKKRSTDDLRDRNASLEKSPKVKRSRSKERSPSNERSPGHKIGSLSSESTDKEQKSPSRSTARSISRERSLNSVGLNEQLRKRALSSTSRERSSKKPPQTSPEGLSDGIFHHTKANNESETTSNVPLSSTAYLKDEGLDTVSDKGVHPEKDLDESEDTERGLEKNNQEKDGEANCSQEQKDFFTTEFVVEEASQEIRKEKEETTDALEGVQTPVKMAKDEDEGTSNESPGKIEDEDDGPHSSSEERNTILTTLDGEHSRSELVSAELDKQHATEFGNKSVEGNLEVESVPSQRAAEFDGQTGEGNLAMETVLSKQHTAEFENQCGEDNLAVGSLLSKQPVTEFNQTGKGNLAMDSVLSKQHATEFESQSGEGNLAVESVPSQRAAEFDGQTGKGNLAMETVLSKQHIAEFENQSGEDNLAVGSLLSKQPATEFNQTGKGNLAMDSVLSKQHATEFESQSGKGNLAMGSVLNKQHAEKFENQSGEGNIAAKTVPPMNSNNTSNLRTEPMAQNLVSNTNKQLEIPPPPIPPPPPYPDHLIPTQSQFIDSHCPRGPPPNMGNYVLPPLISTYPRNFQNPDMVMLQPPLEISHLPVPLNTTGQIVQLGNQNTYNQISDTNFTGNVVPHRFTLGLNEEPLEDKDVSSSHYSQQSSLLGLPTSASVIPFLNDEMPKKSMEKKEEPSNTETKTDTVDSNHAHASSPVDMDMSSPEDDIIERMNEEFWENERRQSITEEACVVQQTCDTQNDPLKQTVLANEEDYDPEDFVTSTSTKKKKKKKKDKPKKSLDALPKTKVQSLIDKLHRQARVEEEVKIVLKDYYKHREITKDEYKDILRKAVPQVANSDHSIDPERIRSLVKKYVAKTKGQRFLNTDS